MKRKLNSKIFTKTNSNCIKKILSITLKNYSCQGSKRISTTDTLIIVPNWMIKKFKIEMKKKSTSTTLRMTMISEILLTTLDSKIFEYIYQSTLHHNHNINKIMKRSLIIRKEECRAYRVPVLLNHLPIWRYLTSSP